jgi:ribosomal protein S8
MSQDLVADALNQMTNALKARKSEVVLKRHSKLMLSILALAKLKGYIKNYSVNGTQLNVEFDKLNNCGAIKPRLHVKVKDINKYISRYLPAKGIGIIIVSTSKGLMAHQTAEELNLGGSLMAYFY